MAKKGEGLTLTTIIIAALVLVVLIVLIAIFSGKINIFGKTYSATQTEAQNKVCWAKGGVCKDSIEYCPSGTLDPGTKFVDCGDGVCCLRS